MGGPSGVVIPALVEAVSVFIPRGILGSGIPDLQGRLEAAMFQRYDPILVIFWQV